MGGTKRSGRKGLSRRQFLASSGTTVALLPALSACNDSSIVTSQQPGSPADDSSGGQTPNNPDTEVFRHGIASGDPLTDRVIFWTHITTNETSVPVVLNVFADPELQQLVGSAEDTATAQRNHCVKIDFAGLQPGTTYYYVFQTPTAQSAIGRTRTAPVAGLDKLRFGVVSCASAAHGYFNAYRHLAARPELDCILHLGDYIYEYGTGEYGDIRAYEPEHEMVTLDDYRTRHAFYKRDTDLMELHRQHPFITTWDDHESTDNSWRDGAVNHQPDTEGDWNTRKSAAQQAYDEWMPIRYPQAGNVGKIWRSFRYGELAEIFILDTRLYDRDEPGSIPADPVVSAEPDRRMIGPEQMNWLLNGLASSSAQWKIIGNQMVFHQWQIGEPSSSGAGVYLNGDAWDGYQAERQQIIDFIRDNNIDDVVILSGDVHSSWCADITDEPSNPLVYNPLTGAGSVAVEFTTTSVTSPSAIPLPQGTQGEQSFIAMNPHIRYLDLDRKGYLLLDLDPTRVQGEYWYVSTHTSPGGDESFALAYRSASGDNHLDPLPLTEPALPIAGLAIPPVLAPGSSIRLLWPHGVTVSPRPL